MKQTQLFFLLVVMALFAESILASPGIQWGEPDTAELLEQAIALEALEEAPETLTQMLLETHIIVEGDKIRKRVREIWYYPSFSEVQNYGMDHINFNRQVDSLTIHTAASMDRHSRVRLFDPQTLKITDTQNNNTFTDMRQAVISLPGLGAGSLTLLDYELISDRGLMEMDWSEVHFPRTFSPVKSYRLTVEWPENELDLKWSVSSDAVSCEAQSGSLHCEGGDLEPVRYDQGVQWADHLDQIVIGELDDWAQVSQRALDAFATALNDTAGADSLLAELTEGEQLQADKIARVHEFVARDIRYVSMSELGHAVTPHSVASVLENRYGDCKDKTAVLYHLLGQLGVEAYPVLVATRRESPKRLQIPSMAYFDHMVLCFEWQGSDYCVDATDSYTDWRHTPAWIQGKVALVLGPDAEPSPISQQRYRWRMAIHSEVVFTPSGGLKETQRRTYLGEYAGMMRGHLAGQSRTERQQWATDRYHEVVSQAASPVFTFAGIDDLVPQLVVDSYAEYEPFPDPGKDLYYTDPDAWLRDEIASLYLHKTHYDDYFSGLKVSSRYEYDVSDSWRLTTLSPKLDLVHRFGQLERTVTRIDRQRFAVETQLRIPAQRVAREDVDTFNAFLDLLARESQIQFMGKRTRQ